MIQGFFLGLASGTVCLANCAPVLLPYLLGEGGKIPRNYALLGQFMGGRLAGYLLFALLAWAAGLYFSIMRHRGLIFGAVYIILAVLMIYTSLRKTENKCLGNCLGKPLIPLTLGFFTGINFCPPFLMAFTEASSIVNLGQCMLFFFMFFLGTAVFFLPLPLVGGLERFLLLKNIGKLAALLIAVYYLYTGLVMIGGS
ncbi:MAG: sulfite exporter TauE/SafE family protein [Eubacteriales bacterium]